MKIQKRELIYKGFYTLNRLFFSEKKGKEKYNREQFVTPNSVGVLLFNTCLKKIILVKQFRIGPEKELIEVVAGKIEHDEKKPMETAKREVLEETGYQVDNIKYIHGFHPCPGPVSEYMELYFAECSEKISKGGGVDSEHETIEIIEMEPMEFVDFIFHDAKSIIAQQWFKLNKTDFLN